MLCAPVLTILFLVAVDLTGSQPPDGAVSVNSITTKSTVTVSASCVTGKYVLGTCVKREKCDYGTAAIDFTLYRPRGFKLSCPSIDDVCCPPQFLVQLDDRAWVPENERFDFDEDD